MYIDDNGKVLTPLYNYLKDYPEELKKGFYNKYKGEEKFCGKNGFSGFRKLEFWNADLQTERRKSIAF